jgi:alanine dehydrogenase
METLAVANVEQVSPEDYLTREFDVPVFCQIGPKYYTKHKNGLDFDFSHFKKFPQEYESTFLPFTKKTDILITGHFWDPRSPEFFSKEDMKKPDFRISIIADISCDVNGPIPSTIRATTISDPFYSFNPLLETEEPAFSKPTNITVMSIDNLPGELPRDASHEFGKMLMSNVLHDLLSEIASPMIERATILRNGKLNARYEYLKDYLNGI